MDSANKLVLINTDTYERKEIDLKKLGVGSNAVDVVGINPPWVGTVTEDNRVVIAAGLGLACILSDCKGFLSKYPR